MGTIIKPSDEHWLKAIRNLYNRGEITLDQYAGCLRRISQSYSAPKSVEQNKAIKRSGVFSESPLFSLDRPFLDDDGMVS